LREELAALRHELAELKNTTHVADTALKTEIAQLRRRHDSRAKWTELVINKT
jgi:hypothetical protein